MQSIILPRFRECTAIVRELCGEEHDCVECARGSGCLGENAEMVCRSLEICRNATDEADGEACEEAAAMHCVPSFLPLMCDEAKEAQSRHVTQFAVLAIVSVLITVTVVFELLKDWVFESTKKEFRPIVEVLFAELTVLGFLGLLVFIVQKTNAMGIMCACCFHLLLPVVRLVFTPPPPRSSRFPTTPMFFVHPPPHFILLYWVVKDSFQPPISC